MKNNVFAYLAMSLDGFIADSSENVTFLESVQGKGDNGFSEFYSDVELVVVGGNTFKWLIENDEVIENPYKDKKIIVVTSKKYETNWDVEFFNGDLKKLEKLFQNYNKVWIVGGGNLISNLINLNMIHILKLTIAPILLVDGIKLFNNLNNDSKLYLTKSTQYNQFMELEYRINYV